jgi:hypothetical protein
MVVLLIGVLGFSHIAIAKEQPETLDVEISPEGVGTVRATLNLPANRVRVRSVLMDYANWPKLFPLTPTIHYIKELEGSVRVGMTVPAFFLPMTLRLVTETREPQPFRIVTKMVEGDFEQYDWVWDLTPTSGGTHTQASLTLNVKPQFWTPDWALVWILKTDLQEHFELLRQELNLKDPRHYEEPPHNGLP